MTFVQTLADTPQEDVLYSETFSKCEGEGGNDGLWSGLSATTDPVFDEGNDDWTSSNAKIYAGNECLRLGTSKYSGTATSPEILMNGEATITFKAGAWNSQSDATTLKLSAKNATLSDDTFTMKKGEWTEFTTTLTGKGKVAFTFSSEKGRFFLDEVKVVSGAETGISSTTATGDNTVSGYYTLDGVKISAPQKGINIVRYADGTTRKVVVM